MAHWCRGILSGLVLSLIGLGFFAAGYHVLWGFFSVASLVGVWFFVMVRGNGKRDDLGS